MPRQETTLTVFVASPADVGDERERLQDVIDEINLTRSRDLGIRLELAKWETHATPGFGNYPQEVINSSMPQDYDIFIGIMWQRFGTPTLRAPSGTIEEFQNAKARFDDDPNSVRIMVYFKDAPIAPSKIDAGQIQAIAEFRNALGPQGGLYWNFEDTDQFERLARIHLQKAMQDWREQAFAPPVRLSPQTEIVPDDQIDSDEPGILDLTIEFTQRMSDGADQMATSNAAMNDATQKLTKLGAELSLQGSKISTKNIRQIQSLASDIAAVFSDLNRDFRKAANAASDNVEAGIDAMIRMVELQGAIKPDDEQAALELIQSLETAQNGLEDYNNQILSTASGLDLMPKISSEIDREKRSLLKTFREVVDRQQRSIGLMKELKQVVFSLLRGKSERD